MRRNIILLSVAALLSVSCGPLSYMMNVELRQPSRAGLELGGKTFAVCAVDDGDALDSVFVASVAEGFARRLETEYFGGEQVIGLYNIDKTPGADYSSRDSVLNVLMDTGSDVVFIFDSPVLGGISAGTPQKVETPAVRDSAYVVEVSVPYSIRLYVYDSMDMSDKVRVYSGSSTAKPVAYTGGNEPDSALVSKALSVVGAAAQEAGATAGAPFLPRWSSESVVFVYYDTGSGDWLNALAAAHDYRWKDAVAIWTGLTSSSSLQKRSCAAYNLAAAFYILGQYDLAGEWLDVSDADYPLYLSHDLRSKIEGKS